jgi:hypothetical protein
MKSSFKQNLVLSAVLLQTMAAMSGISSQALAAEPADKQNHEKDNPEPVHVQINIAAPPLLVWNVVHEERKHDPDMAYSKVLSEKGNEIMLEQKFCLLPVIGTSVCTMQQNETPGQRIDYKLIKSDRFKLMEGSWVLVPSADNKSTTLQLTTLLDLGMPVPRSMFNHICAKKLERRLQHIKEMAEEEAKSAHVAELKKSL